MVVGRDLHKMLEALHSNLVLFKWETMYKCIVCKNLYIPIWFYSNFSQYINSLCNYSLYIPIWFYSNNTKLPTFAVLLHLYIPIWFYSNFSFLACLFATVLSFTFQSGSIQIKVNLGFNIGAEYFTFQSGSIQIYRY